MNFRNVRQRKRNKIYQKMGDKEDIILIQALSHKSQEE